MKGIYKTKEGQKVEVIDFDEANKIALIKLDELQNKWITEDEYKTWESLEEPIQEEVNIETSGDEEIADAVIAEPEVVEEEIITEVNENPVEAEQAKPAKKKITKQPVKKITPKKKGK